MSWFSKLMPWNWGDEVKQKPTPASRTPTRQAPQTSNRSNSGFRRQDTTNNGNGNSNGAPSLTDWQYAVDPEVLANSGNPNKDASTYPKYEPPGTANPSRAPTVPMPSDPTMLLLQRAGWETPEWAAGTGLKPAEIGQDVSRRTELDPYAYTVSPDEYMAVRRAYSNAEGFTPPYADPDDPLRIISRVRTSTPVPLAAYDLLTPAQKQAVDFNTMLLNSVKLDRAGVESSEDERTQYDRDVAELFGKGGGSDTYSPNVVRLLKNMDMDVRGQDLDEYLSLERGYTSDEIANLPDEGLSAFPTSASIPGDNDYAQLRSFNTAVSMDRALIEKAGAFLDEAMTDVSTRKWSRASTAAYGVTGAEAPVEEIPFGWEPLDAQGQSRRATEEDRNKEKIFQNALTFLAERANTDPNLFFQELDARGFSDADRLELFNFIGEKLDFMEQTGGPAYPFLQGSRTSDEIRQFVGLE